MKRTLFFVVVAVAMTFALVGCNAEVKEDSVTDGYMACPFAKGQEIGSETLTDELVGTYIYAGAFKTVDDYRFVSFIEDGTVLVVNYAPYMTSYRDGIRKGTWSVADGKLTASFDGETYTAETMEPFKDGEKGFRIETKRVGSYVYYNTFLKQSNEVMDASIYSDHSRIAGLWAKSDDYGDVTGYRFTSDGRVYKYNTDGDTTKRSWQMSNAKAEVCMTTLDGVDREYQSIFLCGDYLYIGISKYTRIK